MRAEWGASCSCYLRTPSAGCFWQVVLSDYKDNSNPQLLFWGEQWNYIFFSRKSGHVTVQITENLSKVIKYKTNVNQVIFFFWSKSQFYWHVDVSTPFHTKWRSSILHFYTFFLNNEILVVWPDYIINRSQKNVFLYTRCQGKKSFQNHFYNQSVPAFFFKIMVNTQNVSPTMRSCLLIDSVSNI